MKPRIFKRGPLWYVQYGDDLYSAYSFEQACYAAELAVALRR